MRVTFAWLSLLLVACHEKADFTVVEAEQIGTVPRSDWIQGRDGGDSGHAFGRTVWVYGDTVLNMPDENDENWHTNSYDIADPQTWMTGFETPSDSVGAPRFFVELDEEELAWNDLHAAEDCPEKPCSVRWALWPGAPQFDATRNRAWILYGLYNDEFPSGIGIASWDGLDQPVVRRKFGDSYLLFPAPETEWGAATVIDDDTLYGFGCRDKKLSRPCGIGRVPLEDPGDRSAWRFWNGDEWGTDSNDVEHLFDGAPIMELSWNEGLARWLLIYSKPFDRDVVARTAESLNGPWSREKVLFRATDGAWPYDAVHHPDLEEENGLVQYITYSKHTTGWFGSEHQLWRVELAPP